MIPFAFVNEGKSYKGPLYYLLKHNGSAFYWRKSVDGGVTWSSTPTILNGAEITGKLILLGTYSDGRMAIATNNNIFMSSSIESGWSASGIGTARETMGKVFSQSYHNGTWYYAGVRSTSAGGNYKYYPAAYGPSLITVTPWTNIGDSLYIGFPGSAFSAGGNIFWNLDRSSTGTTVLARRTSATAATAFATSSDMNFSYSKGGFIRAGNNNTGAVIGMSGGNLALFASSNWNSTSPAISTITFSGIPMAYGFAVGIYSSKFSKYIVGCTTVRDSASPSTNRLSLPASHQATAMYEGADGEVYVFATNYASGGSQYRSKIYVTHDGISYSEVFSTETSGSKTYGIISIEQ